MPSNSNAAPAHVVVSIGGSIFTTGHGDAAYIDALADLLRRVALDVPLVVTVGGGRTAREYIGIGRELGLTEVELDEIGIDVTRLHARLLAARVGGLAPAHPPTSLARAVHEAHRAPLVVLGGTEPGHTTDAVAALIAVRLRAARVVNATRVDGVYDHDPSTHPNARRLDRLAWPQFLSLVIAGATGQAGQEFVFDRPGAEALSRARIALRVVQGRDLANLESAIRGSAFQGTAVE